MILSRERFLRAKGRYGAAILAAIVMPACSAGGVGEVVQPTPPTAASALGMAGCEGERYGAPLIVDWSGDQRVDLEAAMKTGVAVVAYDCKSLRLLRECSLEGSYGFLGTTRNEQVVKLENKDELGANLPTTAGALGIKLEAEFKRGATLDVALVLIGKQRTTVPRRARPDLQGSCDGATHFVRGATVGAFAMATGAKGSARAAVEVFKVGVATQSSADKSTTSKGGDFDSCLVATPDAPIPPAQCGAPIRLELVALDAQRQAAAPPLAEGPPEDDAPSACPRGTVMQEGKCAAPAPGAPRRCAPQDLRDCEVQCDRGGAESCTLLGIAHAYGRGTPKDDARAVALYRKACDGGDARGCNGVGRLVEEGRGAPKDPALALTLYKKACDGGDGRGCMHLGAMHAAGTATPKSDTDAAASWKRAAELYVGACDKGDPSSCDNLGWMVETGRGVDKDERRAAELYRRACGGGSVFGCSNIGAMAQNGRGVEKDERRAVDLYRRACDGDLALGCSNLGAMYQNGRGVEKDERRAAELYRKACAGGSETACKVLRAPSAPGKE